MKSCSIGCCHATIGDLLKSNNPQLYLQYCTVYECVLISLVLHCEFCRHTELINSVRDIQQQNWKLNTESTECIVTCLPTTFHKNSNFKPRFCGIWTSVSLTQNMEFNCFWEFEIEQSLSWSVASKPTHGLYGKKNLKKRTWHLKKESWRKKRHDRRKREWERRKRTQAS